MRGRDAFLRGLAVPSRAQDVSAERLEGALAAAVENGRARWAGVTVDAETFAAFLAERTPEGPLLEAIASLRHADLYLACACALAQPAALAAFEEHFLPEVERVCKRVSGVSADDLRQKMREKLFMDASGRDAKITTYVGLGDLRHWVRVAAMRTALSLARGPQRRTENDQVLLKVVDSADDPEVAYMKRVYRSEFETALAEAWQALSFRQQNVLRYALGDDLDLDAIAAIYRVHRTTVRRRLVEARDALIGHLRSALLSRLRVTNSELESILRLLQSRIELAQVTTAASDHRIEAARAPAGTPRRCP